MKSKQLTNFRSTGKDDAIRLTPPKRMTLEQAIAYIDDDEMVQVTPKNIRIRKALLDPHERKKAGTKKEAAYDKNRRPPSAAGSTSGHQLARSPRRKHRCPPAYRCYPDCLGL